MELDIRQTTTTGLKTGVPDFKVAQKVLDEAISQGETFWYNENWPTYLGYLKTIPEYARAVRSLSAWASGKGYTTDPATKLQLERIRGWGEDTFDSIIQDMIVVKKTNGDAYAEVIRNDSGTFINLKKLNPSGVRHVVNGKGLLIGYDVKQADGTWERLKVDEIFHVCNDRIANEIHGTSVLESCKWIIGWKNEMMSDLRRVQHRSTIRVLYVDEDDPTKLSTYKTQYAEAIKNGEVLIIPGKPNEGQFQDLTVPAIEGYMRALEYVDNFFYEVLGVPRIIVGGTQGATEANTKVGYLAFEVPSSVEARQMEQDLWNQLAIRVTFEKPASLKEPLQTSEAANTGQVGFQPTEIMPGRNE